MATKYRVIVYYSSKTTFSNNDLNFGKQLWFLVPRTGIEQYTQPGVTAYTYNSSTQETEASFGYIVSSFTNENPKIPDKNNGKIL